MDYKDTNEYKVIIKTGIKCNCFEIDPIGLCSVTDCMNCGNANTKIIRIEDGCVMRDDACGSRYQEKLDRLLYYKSNPMSFIEDYIIPKGKKMSLFQKWYLNKLIKEENK
ncbi:hypothetical protein [Clostridium sp. HBUAS56010]|uniref:hypothetical protein n=1 Tax=Clostridium sp. HBUAS56010 TaxID=2571127 RepID=UPI001178C248|nr:hypothetical protein [Clostridium sp. HBUAS56010]